MRPTVSVQKLHGLNCMNIKGKKKKEGSDLKTNLTVQIFSQTSEKPVAVGFGVSKPQHVQQVGDLHALLRLMISSYIVNTAGSCRSLRGEPTA